jgi:hypothetical protein
LHYAKIKELAFSFFAWIIILARFGFSQILLFFVGSHSFYFLTLHSNDFLTPFLKGQLGKCSFGMQCVYINVAGGQRKIVAKHGSERGTIFFS